jgi:histone H3/H4
MEELDEDMIMNHKNNLTQEETFIDKDNIYRAECDINVHNNKIHKKDVSKSKSKILPPNSNQSSKEAEDKNENLNILIEGIHYLNLDEEIGKTRFPIAKIKNIMKLDENTKLCQKDVYNLIGRATQLFIHELAENSYCITALNKRKTMNIEDLGIILFTISHCDKKK